MDAKRFILILALALVTTMLWQEWQRDYAKDPQDFSGNDLAEFPVEQDMPKVEFDASEILPSLDTDTVSTPDAMVHVHTDVIDVAINTKGGTITQLALKDYPISKQNEDEPYILLYDWADDFYVVQSGLQSQEKINDANHRVYFQSDLSHAELQDGQNELKVKLLWQSPEGLQVVKSYTFYRGDYLVHLTHEVINNTTADWNGAAYLQINRSETNKEGSPFLYTYTGAVLSTPEEHYQKISFSDIRKDKLNVRHADSWFAMLQHYFLAALMPGNPEQRYTYYTLSPNNSYVIGIQSPAQRVQPGERISFEQKLYLGPKLQKDLAKIAKNLDLTVDYGIFWIIAKPLYFVLDWIHQYTGNWGWSIVLLTLLLKLLFYHLSAKSYYSMAKMRKLQPRLLALRERYQNDRMQMNKAMMDIYKTEKINPLGGCLPILVQIPVFISLYWVLLETVELRQADFVLWINDLSAQDPYFILPLLMGVTMYVQHKLNPAPIDPIQQKVMAMLPIIFTVFFVFFPAGLVLYWVVNNILSILQQWLITRQIETKGL